MAVELVLLTLSMGMFSLLPLYSARVRERAETLFLVGTGAMFGICVFDLLPDVHELGGGPSLLLAAGVCGLYAIIHLFRPAHRLLHGIHSGHGHGVGVLPPSSFNLFLAPLVVHCFASGMLLAVSRDFVTGMADTVFAALFVHKAYESLLLATILAPQPRPMAWKADRVLIYTLSLPAGALCMRLFESVLTTALAVAISSVAVGTFLGCLVFDFLLPSLKRIGESRLQLGWIAAGMLLSRLVLHH